MPYPYDIRKYKYFLVSVLLDFLQQLLPQHQQIEYTLLSVLAKTQSKQELKDTSYKTSMNGIYLTV